MIGEKAFVIMTSYSWTQCNRSIMHDGTSRRLSDASSSDPSIRSWTATKWLGSDFCLAQVLEGGSYEPNESPLRTGLRSLTAGTSLVPDPVRRPPFYSPPPRVWKRLHPKPLHGPSLTRTN